MRVVFRVDSSLFIGSGHVMRCLVLAQMFVDLGWFCEFICRDHPGNLSAYIKEKGFIVHVLSANSPNHSIEFGASNGVYDPWLGACWQVDAEQTISVLDRSIKYDLLVIDHYSIEKKWEGVLRPLFVNLLVIDDLANRDHISDYLLDQNFGRKKTDYQDKVPRKCLVFAGSEYALLRPEFSDLRSQSISRRIKSYEVRKIVISMGGIDLENATLEVLRLLSTHQCSQSWEIDVVLGRNSPNLEVITEWVSSAGITVNILVGVENMAELFTRADLFIGGAGSTAWEACCLGVPLLIKVLASNQQENALALQKFGAAFLIEGEGDAGSQFLDKIDLLMQPEVLKYMQSQCLQVTRGLGGKIISRYLDSLCYPPSGIVRKMEYSDLSMVLAWRNHEDVQRFMISKGIISPEEHLGWYQKTIADPARWLLIYEENFIPIGFIQFELVSGLEGVVDWGFYVAPYASKGVGTRMGKAALTYIFSFKNVSIVRGFVLGSNEISKSYHLRMGFSQLSGEVQDSEIKDLQMVGYNLSREQFCMIH